MKINYLIQNSFHRGEIDEIDKVYLGNYKVTIIWNRINKITTIGEGVTFDNALDWALVAYAEMIKNTQG